MMCAAVAGKRGRRVVVLERSEKPGKKILISGGGRCNFTNRVCTAANFLSENPHFAKSALARYTPTDFLALVERYGIPWHEKTLGQLFCDRSAGDIVRMLEAECREAGVRMLMNRTVEQPGTFGARSNESRRDSVRSGGRRDGRTLDSEDGGERLGLQNRTRFRVACGGTGSGAGALDHERRRLGNISGTGRGER